MAMNAVASGLVVSVVPDTGITFPLGFRAAAVRAGLKSKNLDLALIVADQPCPVAGVFTLNLVKAPSVPYSERLVKNGMAQAIFVNAGNANACVGPQGDADNLECAFLTASALGIPQDFVLVASTGVIGRLMPMEKVRAAVPLAAAGIGLSTEIDADVAAAIMTTDLTQKQIAVECRSPHWQGTLRIAGVAKGSGMIAPNMATTLSFVTTDADVSSDLLQAIHSRAIDRTFNRITVDGDTSTNDMCLVLASGASGIPIKSPEAMADFETALEQVLQFLAKEIARDGEGATKLVTVQVVGGRSEEEAAKVAKTIAESPLVKTALYGCDPNWGRIMAAAGRAGVKFDPDKASAWIGDIQVFNHGVGGNFDSDAANTYLKQSEVTLTVDLASGDEAATVWTCDYSYDYIKINAEYHT
jgi:glutamate N-acetyltransferase/amino-acid N-acetyltransferase